MYVTAAYFYRREGYERALVFWVERFPESHFWLSFLLKWLSKFECIVCSFYNIFCIVVVQLHPGTFIWSRPIWFEWGHFFSGKGVLVHKMGHFQIRRPLSPMFGLDWMSSNYKPIVQSGLATPSDRGDPLSFEISYFVDVCLSPRPKDVFFCGHDGHKSAMSQPWISI